MTRATTRYQAAFLAHAALDPALLQRYAVGLAAVALREVAAVIQREPALVRGAGLTTAVAALGGSAAAVALAARAEALHVGTLLELGPVAGLARQIGAVPRVVPADYPHAHDKVA